MDESAMGNILGALIDKQGDNFGGSGGSLLIILLVMMMAWGGNGWGGNNRPMGPTGLATKDDVYASMAIQNNADAVREVGANVTNLGYTGLQQSNTINQNVSQQGADTRLAICQSGNGVQKQVSDTGNNLLMGITTGNNAIIQGLNENRFTLAQEECASRATSTANTQKILDKLCDMQSAAQAQRINDLQVRNQALELQMGNIMQTGNIISALRPYPQPSYIVSSPYVGVGTGGIAIS